MKQILWFRRDLRIEDNALLSHASGEVLPIFIFDVNILKKLKSDDKRVSFIYNSILKLKKDLQSVGLDLAIFFDEPKNVFEKLKNDFDEVLCSCDFDNYAITRDKEIEPIVPMKRFYDSYLFHPSEHLKNDGTPYKVYTPFYKSLFYLWENRSLVEYERNSNLTLYTYDYSKIPSIEDIGFEEQTLEPLFYKDAFDILKEFIPKISNYKEDRDFFYKDGTSNIATHLRFGLISPRQIFNIVKPLANNETYIKELFWREFYNYILYHFPKSEFENFNEKNIIWEENQSDFKAWCEGNTGVPVVDSAMRCFNQTGMMHNRLRMIVASFLTKNLLLDWRKGEEYFAQNLMDYDASTNVGSWQWGASTGADASPYFRVFNPYTQGEKFDKDALFIKKWVPELANINPKLIHKEGALMQTPIVDCKTSRIRAIERFKYAQ